MVATYYYCPKCKLIVNVNNVIDINGQYYHIKYYFKNIYSNTEKVLCGPVIKVVALTHQNEPRPGWMQDDGWGE